MGHCFQKLEGPRQQGVEATKCFERASRTDAEGLSFSPLAKLYKAQGQDAKAAHMYRRVLKLLSEQSAEVEMSVEGARA